MSSLTSSLSSFGRFMATYHFAIALIVGSLFIGMGIYVIYGSTKATARIKIQGTITAMGMCYGTTSSSRKCPITVKYAVNGKDYLFNTTTKQPKILGQVFPVYIDNMNKPEPAYAEDSKQYAAGAMFIVIGLIGIGFAAANRWMSNKSSAYSAYEGASSLRNFF